VNAQRFAIASIGGLLVVFLVLPILALFAMVTLADIQVGLQRSLVWPALRLSLLTTASSLLVVVALGTPLAWTLANRRGRFLDMVETAVQLPIVIPPAVAGVAMLLNGACFGLMSL